MQRKMEKRKEIPRVVALLMMKRKPYNPFRTTAKNMNEYVSDGKALLI